jgi:L-galactose dehydrogenase/L-glyceraldehyde 3-phosphate reductase
MRKSIEGSLSRLGVSKVTLLQLHNAITAARGEEATSLTPRDVLGKRGVLETLLQFREEGLTDYIGLTAVGQAEALRQVVAGGQFDTIQVPYNLLNPSAGRELPASFPESNYGNVIGLASELQMGVFVIRVFAAGALLDQPPSPYTAASKFFTIDLYRRDERRAEQLREWLTGECGLKEASLRFALQHPCVHSAIIGFSRPQHVDQAIDLASKGPLAAQVMQRLSRFHEEMQ